MTSVVRSKLFRGDTLLVYIHHGRLYWSQSPYKTKII